MGYSIPKIGSLQLLVCAAAFFLPVAANGQAPLPGGNWAKISDINCSFGYLGESLPEDFKTVGDLNGDGRSEFVVAGDYGRGYGSTLGALYMVSPDGTVIWWDNPVPWYSEHPKDIAVLGDLDQDGFPEVATIWALSGVMVYSGRSGFVLATNATGATQVAGIGDVDGDGAYDLGLGIPGQDRVEIRGAATNQLIFQMVHPQPGSRFGEDLEGAGDLDGDTIPDLVVSAPNAVGARVEVRLGATGAILHSWSLPASVAIGATLDLDASGDVDGDGVRDVAIGVRSADLVLVHSGADGSLLASIQGPTGSGFGFSVSIRGDLDGDGLADLAIGAPVAAGGVGALDGRVWAYRSSDWMLIFRRAGGGPYTRFGAALEITDDVDGDGRDDLLIGSPVQTSLVTSNRPWITVYRFNPYLTASSRELSATPGTTLDLELAFPQVDAFKGYRILGSASGAGWTPFQGEYIPLAPDPYLNLMAQGWAPSALQGGSGVLDSQARAIAVITATPAFAPAVGRTIAVAAVSFDALPVPTMLRSSASVLVRITP